ncbi:hypothetical protein FIBSPDRAFT_890607 [Athelia psychrophila]|uniref:Uncharacterized protein n=1 Tax=Athelia psychrophila TaxID=1759441 RepID=A0A166KUR3_9AGAM|nr:hypothetical protein FIBSPDRAFT_890607 [Fibularhizoctonia sp. CBS 109695]
MGWASGAWMVGRECTQCGFTAAAKVGVRTGSRVGEHDLGAGCGVRVGVRGNWWCVLCTRGGKGAGMGAVGCREGTVGGCKREWVQARVEPDRIGRAAGYMRASYGRAWELGAGQGLGAYTCGGWVQIGRGLEIGAGSADAGWMGAGGEHGCVRDMGGEARRGWVRDWPAQMRMWWKTGCSWGVRVCMRERVGRPQSSFLIPAPFLSLSTLSCSSLAVDGWQVSERETRFEPDQAHASSKTRLLCMRWRKGERGESEYSGEGIGGAGRQRERSDQMEQRSECGRAGNTLGVLDFPPMTCIW